MRQLGTQLRSLMSGSPQPETNDEEGEARGSRPSSPNGNGQENEKSDFMKRRRSRGISLSVPGGNLSSLITPISSGRSSPVTETAPVVTLVVEPDPTQILPDQQQESPQQPTQLHGNEVDKLRHEIEEGMREPPGPLPQELRRLNEVIDDVVAVQLHFKKCLHDMEVDSSSLEEALHGIGSLWQKKAQELQRDEQMFQEVLEDIKLHVEAAHEDMEGIFEDVREKIDRTEIDLAAQAMYIVNSADENDASVVQISNNFGNETDTPQVKIKPAKMRLSRGKAMTWTSQKGDAGSLEVKPKMQENNNLTNSWYDDDDGRTLRETRAGTPFSELEERCPD